MNAARNNLNDGAPYPLNTAKQAMAWAMMLVCILGCVFLAALAVYRIYQMTGG